MKKIEAGRRKGWRRRKRRRERRRFARIKLIYYYNFYVLEDGEAVR